MRGRRERKEDRKKRHKRLWKVNVITQFLFKPMCKLFYHLTNAELGTVRRPKISFLLRVID